MKRLRERENWVPVLQVFDNFEFYSNYTELIWTYTMLGASLVCTLFFMRVPQLFSRVCISRFFLIQDFFRQSNVLFEFAKHPYCHLTLGENWVEYISISCKKK